MRPDDEHARIRETERAAQARVLTESPLWDEAYTTLVNHEMEAMLAKGTPDDQTLECKRRILALYDVKRYFATVMQTGELAQRQLDEAKK